MNGSRIPIKLTVCKTFTSGDGNNKERSQDKLKLWVFVKDSFLCKYKTLRLHSPGNVFLFFHLDDAASKYITLNALYYTEKNNTGEDIRNSVL